LLCRKRPPFTVVHIGGYDYMSESSYMCFKLIFCMLVVLIILSLITTWSMYWLSDEDVRHTFHFRHEKMTPTLKDVTILLELCIDEWTITSTGVRNKIMLYEWSFRLAPPPFELKGVTHVLSGLMRYFRHHHMMVTMSYWWGTKSIMI